MVTKEWQIMYEDNDIIVCYKNAGLAVQSARLGTRDMVSILKTYLKEQAPNAGETYLAVVHRLDQPVRGLVIFAKNKKAAAALSSQLIDGHMEKRYLAMVHAQREEHDSSLQPGVHKLVDYLVKDARTNLSRVVPEKTAGAKRADLTYECLKTFREEKTGRMEALLEVQLGTGRHHQIRVQLSHAGLPIIGDRKYGDDPEGTGTPFPLLCAWKLAFDHPATGKRMQISAEPDMIDFPEIL